MKLCFIANPNSFHTYRWLAYFAGRGHDVHLIAERRPEEQFPKIPKVTFHDLTTITSVRKLHYLFWAATVRRLVHQLQPDLLHAHQVTSAGWLGWAANYHPFVVTPWGTDLYQHPQRSRLIRFLARRVLSTADLMTADSNDLLAQAISLGADPNRSQFVHWGIDLTTFTPTNNRDQLRPQLGINNEPVILSPRVLKPFYRHDTIIDAIPAVRRVFPKATFIFRDYNADPPDYAAQLKRRAQALDVSEAVQFIGPIAQYKDIVDIYHIADLVISIPVTDGAALSVLESLACGIPVIVGDLPSLREWITDGQNGLLVPGDDVEALARAIIRLLTDRSLYTRIRGGALQTVRDRADHAAWMARVESMYRELVE